MPTEPRFAFVLGTGRCGSTLVHEILARHSEVGFLSNLDDRLRLGPASRWNGALYRRLPPSFTRKGRLRFAPSEGYRLIDRAVSPALSTPARDLTEADATPWLAGRLADLFGAQARVQDRAVFLHKFTGWPRARFLAAALPGSRFVHIVRDGRAVANSWLQMPWWRGYGGPDAWQFGPLPPSYAEEWERGGRSFVVLAGIAWKLLIDAYAEARAALPTDSWLELRYEDVVADPAARSTQMLEHLGLRPNAAFAAQLARHRVTTSRAASFCAELGETEAARLEASLSEHLARFGYVVGSD